MEGSQLKKSSDCRPELIEAVEVRQMLKCRYFSVRSARSSTLCPPSVDARGKVPISFGIIPNSCVTSAGLSSATLTVIDLEDITTVNNSR